MDLFVDTASRDAVRAEFTEKTKGITYKWLVPDGPPVVKR